MAVPSKSLGRSLRSHVATALAAATLAMPAIGSTLTLTELGGTGFTVSGIVQDGSGQLARGGGMIPWVTGSGDAASLSSVGLGRSGALGVNTSGGVSFIALDTFGTPPTGPTSSTVNFGLAPTGGFLVTSGLYAGVDTRGGVTALEPLSGLVIASLRSGFFSGHSDLLAFSPDGRLGFMRTVVGGVMNSATFGAEVLSSRPLGFLPDGGLAFVAGMFVGVNAQGSLNAYVPELDLLFDGIGPAGLFSTAGGLVDLAVGPGGLDARFPGSAALQGTSGALGITPDGGLAYVRLDVIGVDRSANPHFRSTGSFGLDPASDLARLSGNLALAHDLPPVPGVPEPGTLALVAAAGSLSALARRRKALVPAARA